MGLNENVLGAESSLYLKQHQNNPVNWQPWRDDIFEIAQRANKPVLISIGYSACHWCHVMEHECFEDPEVAELMNRYFINVKVDREERPDVDQVYMTAVQIMQKQGGWPLNCFTLPDGRPIHGGTYFPKEQWMHILTSLHEVIAHNPDKAEAYAENLMQGIQQVSIVEKKEVSNAFSLIDLQEMVQRWSKQFDHQEGGMSRAPKFPMPSNLNFLLEYGAQQKVDRILEFACLTLEKIIRGGIYDQVGGGISRYSIDLLWKVPHFEKMLYDNGQFLEVLAKGFLLTQKEEYKRAILQTVAWLNREMLSEDGAYCAAMDADSEGEEGKFYCWNEAEVLQYVPNDHPWLKDYFEVNQRGFWEADKYILLRRKSDTWWMAKTGLEKSAFYEAIDAFRQELLMVRNKRVKPGLDEKIIGSWNALLLKGLLKVKEVMEEDEVSVSIKRLYDYLSKKSVDNTGRVYRIIRKNQEDIPGFLEDYAALASGMLAYYQSTFETEALEIAEKIVRQAITQFWDESSGMFFYSSAKLIAQSMEIHDNVIPSSNAMMAHALYELGLLIRKDVYVEMAEQMLSNVQDQLIQHGGSFSEWSRLMLRFTSGRPEIHIHGPKKLEYLRTLKRTQASIAVFMDGNQSHIETQPAEDSENQTIIYQCANKACSQPFTDVASFLRQTE